MRLSDLKKTCKFKQLTPDYIKIYINGNNTRAQRTENIAIGQRINLELSFPYIKKQKLNSQLYKIHLKWAAHWPTTWNLIQAMTDNNIHEGIEAHYNRLNKKLGQLLQKIEITYTYRTK